MQRYKSVWAELKSEHFASNTQYFNFPSIYYLWIYTLTRLGKARWHGDDGLEIAFVTNDGVIAFKRPQWTDYV